MAKPLVSEDLCAAAAPLLPLERPKPKGGRPRVPDRAALTGILFVRRTGTPWEHLPADQDCGSGTACWRRRDRQVAGVWARLRKVLLDRLEAARRIRRDRAVLGSTALAITRGCRDGAEPDGPRPAAPQILEAARRQGLRRASRPRGPAQAGHYPAHRWRGAEDRRRLGGHRWVVERSFAWMARFRRLVIRYERRAQRMRHLPQKRRLRFHVKAAGSRPDDPNSLGRSTYAGSGQ